MYLGVLKYGMTSWPRFPISINDLGNWVKVEDMLTLRRALSTEFCGVFCRDCQIAWRPHIRKVLPGCIIAHSTTPVLQVWLGTVCGCSGVGMQAGLGWDVAGIGGR